MKGVNLSNPPLQLPFCSTCLPSPVSLILLSLLYQYQVSATLNPTLSPSLTPTIETIAPSKSPTDSDDDEDLEDQEYINTASPVPPYCHQVSYSLALGESPSPSRLAMLYYTRKPDCQLLDLTLSPQLCVKQWQPYMTNHQSIRVKKKENAKKCKTKAKSKNNAKIKHNKRHNKCKKIAK